MTREEWRRIKAVAAEAWDRPSPDRAAFVAAACAGDAQLRSEVERLLQSADTATDLYEDPLWPAAADLASAFDEVTAAAPPLIGMRVGPYRIVRELGRGGMGQVYLAERSDGEFEQRVAVKFVSNLPTTALLQRFRAERRILATLDHPNIARLMDGGATPDGHPYLVMEYVAGVPIDEFCVSSDLTINERLELVRRVCDAVQYAHQHLVIHRDLKPRNILVTADGTPKLLDFGIAKLLDSELTTAESTRTMFRLVTPETASPEQVRGEPITTATDVYALGGLLYRLLTGQTPYEVQAPTDAEWIRAICEQTPRAPSRRGDSQRDGGRRDSPSIDRDIDLIVLKALRKEPERRYATVNELSDDLKRYLNGRPIKAGPDDRLYRARKFVGRNRVGLAAAVAVGVALTAGTLATARQAQIAGRERARAQGRFDDVRQLANTFMFEVHDAIQTLPGSTPVRRLMITRVLDTSRSLVATRTRSHNFSWKSRRRIKRSAASRGIRIFRISAMSPAPCAAIKRRCRSVSRWSIGMRTYRTAPRWPPVTTWWRTCSGPKDRFRTRCTTISLPSRCGNLFPTPMWPVKAGGWTWPPATTAWGRPC